jgi:putative redox protein
MANTQEFVFDGSKGLLSGRLTRPGGTPRATAVFAHCFTCSKDIPAVKRITEALAARGIAVLSFDFTGLGHSEGEFQNTNFSSNIADLVAAANAMATQIAPPALLVGHSLGGAAVIRAAAQLDSVVAVATIGAPSDPQHLERLFVGELEAIKKTGSAEVDLGGRPFVITQQFLDDIAKQTLHGALLGMKAALLVMHAPGDEVVEIQNASEIFQAALHPKSFVSLDDADHLMRRVKDADYAAGVIASWADRYLPEMVKETSAEAPDGAVVVRELSAEGFTQEVVVGGAHTLFADEPADMGGADRGPTPYGFLAIGLGACTSMTMRLYARRKKIPLESISVTVTHDKRHAVECEGCETSEPKADHFLRTITVGGTLTEEQIASLLAIADKCPVHRTLERSSHIETVLGG